MSNAKVYRKTLPFSFLMFLIDLLVLGVIIGLATAGYFIAKDNVSWHAFVGLGIGLVVGIIISVIVTYLVQNRFKAAQIAMMTRGVTTGDLPDHIVHEGLAELKGRFGKITLYFFITNGIKAVFREMGRAMTRAGKAVGGDVGEGVTSAIDSGVQTVIGYLCDCCLGWILYRKDMNSAKAACEGCVIFFKHGKSLVRNLGRIFGMGLLFFILIGGGLFGLLYVIFRQFPQAFIDLGAQIAKIGTETGTDIPAWVSDPNLLGIVVAAILAIVLWNMVHSVLIRPFILVGVLRNFMEAGKAHIPTDAEIGDLEKKFPKFSKLRQNA